MESNSEKEASQKKPYTSPRVMKIDLKREEVMLGSCKASDSDSGGRTDSSCSLCGLSYGS
jgi:hypothetical protein